jgi:outer membrane protein assembly factor BamB
LVNKDGVFKIFNKESGKMVFQKNLFEILKSNNIKLKQTKVSNLFTASGVIYVSTDNKFVFQINSLNLESIVYLKVSKSPQSNLVFSDGSAYFISSNKIYKN